MSRLSIELTEFQHKQIKTLAALNGQSMKEYVLDKLFKTENVDDKHWQAFDNMIQDRISKSQDVSDLSIEEIYQDELNKHPRS